MTVVTEFETRCLHSLVKVFADEELAAPACEEGSALIGEHYSFQVAYRSPSLLRNVRVGVESSLQGSISVRSVGLVPVELPQYGDHDAYVLRTAPGLYPDPLYPLAADSVHALPGQWRAVWITVSVPEEGLSGLAEPEEGMSGGAGQPGLDGLSGGPRQPGLGGLSGIHPIHIRFADEEGHSLGEACFRLEVIGAALPKQELIHTEWFYLDCLATWYGTEVFSERHWDLIASYVRVYAEYGMNMILTPLFSPPLELDYGQERPTVQLIGVSADGEGRYTFDFSRLERWVALCRGEGVKHFEFSHFFTQWGAKHAPKIVGTANGSETRLFGWDTDATGEPYSRFLRQFIPELMRFIRLHGLDDHAYFHISDEPWIGDMPFYENASTLLRSLIKDFPVIDALSDYTFYANGLLTHPVVSTEHIDAFIANKADRLWAYYCCCEYKHYESNRFMGMPSERTRVIGLQLYKFGVQGFLHWGFNHWYSQRSRKAVNPYEVTDADHGFPSGDAFLVYPGKDGPVSSIRMELLREAMQDVRALRLLEGLAGQAEAVGCLEEGMAEPLTFRHYEHSAAWLIAVRERVNRRIKMLLHG